MEIDLNHAVVDTTEVVKKKRKKNSSCSCTNEECDKGGGGCVYCSLSSSTTSSCSSNEDSSSSPSKMFMELWYACAGPITSLPKKGNVVNYFPQGHLEQASSISSFPALDVPTFDLQPQIFCKILEVELLANKENDEVYTQLTLLPLSDLQAIHLEGKEREEDGTDGEGSGGVLIKSTSHMFCKTLTASDTSTHGGFSVPRRAAEDCFPPLDYKEQRPSQELVAKDLHGVEWKFRHIYRGQPRRHLLTTGWSIFVSQKNLVSGDGVLFLRGEGGELRLGIRRAAGLRNGLSDSIIKNQHSYPNVLAPVANAISSKGTFQVFYSPRASYADFIVPYQKYVKSIANKIPVGTRFKIRVDLDDSPERRYSGVVTGVGDTDPGRWPNSKWRCLMVRWDEDAASNHQEQRVSPWEIDFSTSYPTLNIQTPPRMKRMPTSLQADLHNSSPNSSDVLLPGPHGTNTTSGQKDVLLPSPWNSYMPGHGSLWDFAESVRSGKVLQGQEILGLVSPLYGSDNKINRQLDFDTHPLAHHNLVLNRMEKSNYGERSRIQPSASFSGSLESNSFPKVLQGQEICSLKSLTRKPELNPGAWIKPEFSYVNQRLSPNCYPLASEGIRNMVLPYNGVYKAGQDPVMLSYMTNLQRDNHVLSTNSVRDGLSREEKRIPPLANDQRALGKTSIFPVSGVPLKDKKDENSNGVGGVFKIFGFSLTEEPPTSNSQGSNRRSCTKVHKQGNLVGRAIDLSRLNSYDDLMIELEKLFSMEGLLTDPNQGWRILYTDSENDMMVVGDDPWHEFVEVVSKIHIYTREEVEKMSIGIFGDDTQSCLEEAPPAADVSKSSSA